MTDRASTAAKNRLAKSTSPYLRQHETNPVDWFEWGPEALDKAQREDKPILLSVGYSACHWCHVMAHESFEDDSTAALMNEHFVSIKVDREERPDIDAIYQQVVQLMGQGGGWPLTVFLTPEQKPFYGGTYFPKEPMHGRPSFRDVLAALADTYANKREKVAEQSAAFVDGMASLAALIDESAGRSTGPSPTDAEALRVAGTALLRRIDETWGGFGRAPKFPNPTALEILLALARGGDEAASGALRLTLDKMYRGGIYDHLRGGFARYSVDRVWLVPHFEKMLYDNAQLLGLYADASRIWPDLRPVVVETIAYLEADMLDEHGGFYAATDADSEGEEGKYFCWTPAQVAEVLGDAAKAETFCAVYSVKEGGNFEHGWSILNLPRTLTERADDLDRDLAELEAELASSRAKLLEHRYTRVPPERDDKVLTAWNALLVSGLARAAAAVPEVAARAETMAVRTAERLVDAHVQGVWGGEAGQVLRAGFEGGVHTRGYLQDVAFLARACLDLHELTLQRAWLERARDLAAHAVADYGRVDRRGFYLASASGEALLERTESQHDGPIPAGVGVMVEVLLRLDAAEAAPEGAAEMAANIAQRFCAAVDEPFAYASLILGAQRASADAVHVTIRGPSPGDSAVGAIARSVRGAASGSSFPVGASFVEADEASAIVCRGQTCTAPLRGADAVRDELAK